jgi:phosphate transport system protein
MLEKRISILKEELLKMANIAEEMVNNSMKALVEKDINLAKEVKFKKEPVVNNLEVEIDEYAIETLALFQPKARDLRTVAMIMKMNNDLERVGDLATNIAEFDMELIPQPDVKPYIDLPRMANIAVQMLDDAITAFISQDSKLGRDVCRRDDIVDNLNEQIIRELLTFMIQDPKTIGRSLQIIRISENLERVADLATNIGEDVVYIVESEVIKHKPKK